MSRLIDCCNMKGSSLRKLHLWIKARLSNVDRDAGLD